MFKEIEPEQIEDNTFKLIGFDWMLITAGTFKNYNIMTASWGGFGILWGKKICFCVIRPTRYTYGFMEKSENFTICFFEEKYRKMLEFCGSHSGKNVNKVSATGITPVAGNFDTVHFSEARLVLICRKIYFHDLNPYNFLDSTIHDNYSKKDYHRMYIGEIIKCLKQDTKTNV